METPKNPAEMFKYDAKTLNTIREKLKKAGLWNPDKRFLKYKQYASLPESEIVTALTEEQLVEMQQINEDHEDLIWANAEIIMECILLAVKDEYKELFVDNFPFSRGCLFQLLVPRIR